MDRRYKKRIDRYWKKMTDYSADSLSELSMESWFDYWHTHPDWEGKGNRRSENRNSAAALGYQLLQQAEALAASKQQPVQIWATVCENTSDNAVYVHSENENGTPFPHTFDDCTWGITELPGLSLDIDLNRHEIGLMNYSERTIYIIRSKT